ncbi:Na(+)/H(+) antiporter subunit B [Pararhodospirillum oryzae]|uniref:Cation:proton antiporter n=1 Tax=Pararhodospirillum oryzae TaxID=478448 RepID=A0A512HBI0_9PROT|nr:Na(+)/H(+) antiporter subunit B [Pararhodospirillum oryzae]GEO82809.1 cation:proton antiporter [Pararhodospirillum oryzae]
MQNRPIARIGAKILTPPLMLFALYVQFHGDLGPGGGFQAGVIFAVGFILYALLFGLERARRAVPPGLLLPLAALGVLIYAGTGVAGLLLGGSYLDYNVLAHEPHHGQHLGIFLVELGVGLTVSSIMTTLFFCFAGRGR